MSKCEKRTSFQSKPRPSFHWAMCSLYLCANSAESRVGLSKQPGGRAEPGGRAGLSRGAKQPTRLGSNGVTEQPLRAKDTTGSRVLRVLSQMQTSQVYVNPPVSAQIRNPTSNRSPFNIKRWTNCKLELCALMTDIVLLIKTLTFSPQDDFGIYPSFCIQKPG